MKRRAFLKSAASLFVPAMPALILPRSARAQLNGGMMFPGPGTPASSGGGYTGPGDIYPFVAWYGLRAYNAAYATGTNPAIDVVDQVGANTLTVNITSAGNLDVAAISAWVTSHSVTTIQISKIYDQVGTRNLTVATGLPVLTLNAQGTLPLMTAAQTSAQSMVSTTSLTQAAPYTVSLVALRSSSASGSHNFAFGDGSNSVGFGFSNTANKAEVYSAGIQASLLGVTDSILHSMQFLATTSGSGTFVAVDGTSGSTGGNITSGFSAGQIFLFESFGFHLTGAIGEAGIASGDQTAHNAAMQANQKSYWGTP
jgi:hypothetical protein